MSRDDILCWLKKVSLTLGVIGVMIAILVAVGWAPWEMLEAEAAKEKHLEMEARSLDAHNKLLERIDRDHTDCKDKHDDVKGELQIIKSRTWQLLENDK